jgi:sugar phosphate isomerase/epimerase
MAEAGFECLSLNFHMIYGQGDMAEYAKQSLAALDGTGVGISSIGYYCNALQYEEHQKTLEMFIDNAHLFGTGIVTTFAGACEGGTVEESMPRFKKVFGELAKRAESKNVKIAIENCPMGGSWQKCTCNIAFNPKAWDMMFSEVDSPAVGLEWEPAHQMVQLIDPLPQLRKWAKKVLHVHGKDAMIDWEAVRRLGVFGAHGYAVSRTPGFGDTNWRDVMTVLYANGYDGDICVEGYHDPIFIGEWEMTGQLHALNYLKWCRGGDFIVNPWENSGFNNTAYETGE